MYHFYKIQNEAKLHGILFSYIYIMIKLLSKGTKNKSGTCLLVERWRKEIREGHTVDADTGNVLVFEW